MSALRVLLAMLMFAAAPAQPNRNEFHFVADVSASEAAQTYLTITPDIWTNATSDLRDLRLFAADEQVPYLLMPGPGMEVRDTEREATILNLGRVNGETQFVVDTHQGDTRSAFEAVQLKLKDSTPDFVTSAHVEGFNRFEDTPTDLGKTTLFKLEGEKLGANLTVKFRPVVFRYVRIRMLKVEPKAIEKAQVFSPGTAYSWTEVPLNTRMRIEGHDSIFEWDMSDTLPIGRIQFSIDSAKDFWRNVELRGTEGYSIAQGSIWSIQRRGTAERSANFELSLPGEYRSKHFKLIIRNGDDPPLQASLKAAYRERRLYFTPTRSGALQLYFGNADMERPTYDYARTQGPSAEAKHAPVANVRPNPTYTEPPDKRPWTERHPAVLWIALGIAVIGLGAVALKSLKTGRARVTGDRG